LADVLDRLNTALAGRYAIEREIGAGGMGTVYLAEDLDHHRKVAVKVVRPELAAAVGLERFLREIDVTARLVHPHILPLFNSGQAEGILFYVMPFVDGESLRVRLDREKQLSVTDALQITREVATGLSHAHRHDVVHRDIKPENILLSGGTAVITDFGIARAMTVAGGTQLTEVGTAVGTATYMSPEQVAGEQGIDGRSDLYSLGCVLFEMLAGSPPYTGSTVESILRQHVAAELPSITVLRPSVPAKVVRIIARTLAKTPADRHDSADVLAEDLRQAVSGESDTRVQWVAEARAGKRRLGAKIGAIAGVVVPLLVLAGWVVFGSGPTSSSADTEQVVLINPFTVLSSGDDEPVGDGLSEEIRNRLSSVADLAVLGRTTSLEVSRVGMTLEEVRRQFGVDYLLDGTVQITTDTAGTRQLRIIPSLINAETGSQEWSTSYSSALDDVLDLHPEIAEGVLRALGVTPAASELAAVTGQFTSSSEAHNYYQLGEMSLRTRWFGGMEDADVAFSQAVALDSSFALAHARLGLTLAFLSRAGSREVRLPSALAAARRALELDPDLPEGFLAMAAYHYECCRNYDSAFAYGRLAEETLPDDVLVLTMMTALYKRTGNWERAAQTAARAVKIDPLALAPNQEAVVTHSNLRLYGEAERFADRVIALRPLDIRGYLTKAEILINRQSDVGAASAVMQEGAALLNIDYAEAISVGLYHDRPVFRILCTHEVGRRRISSGFERPSGRGALSLPAGYYAELGYGYHYPLANLHWQVEERELARAHADSAVSAINRLPEQYRNYRTLASLYAILGEIEKAVDAAEHAVALEIERDKWEYEHALVRLAETRVRVGDLDGALETLRQLLSMPSDISVWLLRSDPLWEPLRQLPRFEAMLADFQL
jgi:serine/threonine-protein kinase